jgi:hypothetical protein
MYFIVHDDFLSIGSLLTNLEILYIKDVYIILWKLQNLWLLQMKGPIFQLQGDCSNFEQIASPIIGHDYPSM